MSTDPTAAHLVTGRLPATPSAVEQPLPAVETSRPVADRETARETSAPEHTGPRLFVLRRKVDVSGVSGTGDVAEGVAFSDGTVALRWLSAWPTSVVFHDRGIEAVEAVHGHNGATEVVWL